MEDVKEGYENIKDNLKGRSIDGLEKVAYYDARQADDQYYRGPSPTTGQKYKLASDVDSVN